MVLGWNMEYMDDRGREHRTTTSPRLLNEVTYPIMMSDVIDSPSPEEKAFIEDMFYRRPSLETDSAETEAAEANDDQEDTDQKGEAASETDLDASEQGATTDSSAESASCEGKILGLKQGYYGFIGAEGYPDNLFFHASSLIDCQFEDLVEGLAVKFTVETSPKGMIACDVELIP